MATTDSTFARTDSDQFDHRPVLRTIVYVGFVVAAATVATGAAVLLVSLTGGLGSFVAVSAGWLAAVSSSPSLAKRGVKRFDAVDGGRRDATSARAVVAALITR